MSAGEFVLVVIALLVVAVAGGDLGTGDRIGVAPLLAMAIGGQNAAVRQLKVFDLTTTVLTMTLTGMAADIRERDRFAVLRRLLAVGAMLVGALLGAWLVIEVGDAAALGLAAMLLAIVTASGSAASRSPAQWHRQPGTNAE